MLAATPGALADIARREGAASAMLTMIETVCADATTCPSACGHDMFAAAVWRLHSQRSAT